MLRIRIGGICIRFVDSHYHFMNIIIKTKNVELTGYLEKFINEKIGRLDKFLRGSIHGVLVEIKKESKHHKQGDIFMAEIIIDLPGKKLMAKSHGEDVMKAVSDAKDEMEIEIKKNKTKTVEAPRREAKKSRKEIF